ncbi:MAG: hypothetical protein GF408_01505 [Candidatus Omnitrophica bacterium]|nr:hypothetical protein [Candidatus Omnitrophota bacterium]
MKKHAGFFIFFLGVIILFLGKLITLDHGFLAADYGAQHYPWALEYSRALKSLSFPFWTRYIHSGFPLMAEGQIGGFYPLNIVMFFLLPFRAAYNYSTVLHFALAGISMYFYARRTGAGQWGGSLSALLFCFGSAYAGCFYNVPALKVLSWFPLVLLLFEKYISARKVRYLWFAGVILGMQFLAGAFQFAAYSLLFSLLYMAYRYRMEGRGVYRCIPPFLLFAVTGGVMFLPQFILTSRLARLSVRSGMTLDFALWGSFSPLGFLGTVFPSWAGYLGRQLYISVFGLLFFIFACFFTGREKRLRPLIMMAAVSLFMALGRFNPLYVLLVRHTGAYVFRGPARAIFFAVFSMSVLAGFGFSKMSSVEAAGERKRAVKVFLGWVGLTGASFAAARFFLSVFREQVISFGNWWVRRFVYGKPHHRYDLETYLDKVKSLYSAVLEHMSPADPFIAVSWALIGLSFALGFYLLRRPLKGRAAKAMVTAAILADLLVYGSYGMGFGGNILSFDVLDPGEPGLLSRLKEEKELFRVMPYGAYSDELPRWITPNRNMVYGIDSIAVYSPLSNKSYKRELSGLEVVDDSMGLEDPRPGALEKNAGVLRSLNTRYILSPVELDEPFLKRVYPRSDTFVYELEGYLPRFYFADTLEAEAGVEAGAVTVRDYRSGYAALTVDAPREGFVVFSENPYPGWKARIDGSGASVISCPPVQAVSVPAGRHEIEFFYDPFNIR